MEGNLTRGTCPYPVLLACKTMSVMTFCNTTSREPTDIHQFGLFKQPDSHYDVGEVITRKGPTLRGVNPTAVPGQMVLSLDNWNCDVFPLHKAISLEAYWKKRGAVSAFCVAGFREAPFT